MSVEFFTIEKLADLDGGRVLEAFGSEMKRAVLDCGDRPKVDRPRKVSIEAEIMPDAVDSDGGQLDGVRIRFHVKSTVPARKSRAYSMGIKAGGQLIFSTEDPLNFRQSTFFDGEPVATVESKTAEVRQPR